MLLLSIRSWIFPFRTKQSSIEWVIYQWYGQYVGFSVRPAPRGVLFRITLRCYVPEAFQIAPSCFLGERNILTPGVLGVRCAYPRFALVHFGIRLERLLGQFISLLRASSYKASWMTMSRHYIGFLPLCYSRGKQKPSLRTIFFGAFLTPV